MSTGGQSVLPAQPGDKRQVVIKSVRYFLNHTHVLPISKIWSDKYACTGEIKGGVTKLRHKWFIVTSNYDIDTLFADKGGVMCAAIKRRFKEIEFREKQDSIPELNE